jgi:hypothetical protein
MTIDERIEKIEGQLIRERCFNRCMIACIILLLGIWFISKNLSGLKEIRASRFILEDEKGYTRAALEMHVMGGPVLQLKSRNGRSYATFGLFNHGPMLTMSDWKQTASVILSMSDRTSSLQLIDENHKLRAMLSVNKKGPKLEMNDENGNEIWSAP